MRAFTDRGSLSCTGMRAAGAVRAVGLALLLSSAGARGLQDFRHYGAVNYAPSHRGTAEAAQPIVLDESSFPPELLKSATFETVDGLPSDFIWGAATASYQVEGAINEGGSGVSNWTKFSHQPGRVSHNDNGDIADDQYHRFKEDIKFVADMGLTSYRLSLSWSRIMPTGELPLNQEGVDHYNDVINTVRENGLIPLVTIFHWDLPQALEDKYGGWLNVDIQDVFATFAEECYKAFGDRVTHWLTFNEPWSFIRSGYSLGNFPPGRCSDRNMCAEGDSGTETYIAGHNVINAHAKAAAIYLDKYAAKQGGSVGITLNCDWAEPMTSHPGDAAAGQRFLEFEVGWFADPVYFGRYPPSMVERVGTRLPEFTKKEAALLKRTSPKWFGLNHYSTNFAADRLVHLGLKGKAFEEARQADLDARPGTWDSDIGIVMTSIDANGDPIGPTGDSPWLHVVPWGLRKLLNWIYDRYGAPILITENGADVPGENGLGLPFVLRDPFRIKYLSGYIGQVNLAVKEDKVPVIGYFAWSLLDNFEWADGYSKRFGLVYVDYTTQKRYPKASAAWYAKLVRVFKQGADPADHTTTAGDSNLATSGAPTGGSGGGSSRSDGGGALPSLLALAAAVAVGAAFGVAGLTRWQAQRRATTANFNNNFNNGSASLHGSSGGGGAGGKAEEAVASRGSGNHGREPLFTPHSLAARLPFGERHAYSPVAAEAGETARV